MQTPLSDVCTQGMFSNKSPSFIAILLKSQQNSAMGFFFLVPSLPRQSYSLYEKGATASSPSLFSHSATYTLLSHTAPCTDSSCTCISLTQEKKKKPMPQCVHPTRVTHSHRRAHIHTYGSESQAAEMGQADLALCCGFLFFFLLSLQNRRVKRFLLSPAVPPPPSSHKYPLWVLYEPILFSPTRSQRCHGHVLLSL